MGDTVVPPPDGRQPPRRCASEIRPVPTVKVQDVEPATVIVFFDCAARHKGGTGKGR